MAASGFLNLDKPAGWTSRAAVDYVIDVAGTRRVGHAGTLDPMASGVLVVAVERATRLIEYVQRMPKTYEATVLLGKTSDTDDLEGTVQEHPAAAMPDRAALEAALGAFVGTTLQRPPGFSAIKQGGKRAYRLARKGVDVALPPRPVTIHSIELLRYQEPEVDLCIRCGSGTYIRAIARDLGERLQTGGLLSQLRRTAIGSFLAEAAVSPYQLDVAGLQDRLLPLAAGVAEVPRLTLDADGAQRFSLGQLIARPVDLPPGEVAVVAETGRLLGIGVWDPVHHLLKPVKVVPETGDD